ncbi:ABC transporter permease [Photobacterium galatheae]|uniref:Peptide ABC transporter permease n=1 Tax=Photobacterium galatheae TaxID=1654360 RepID=A0A066RXW7_9GAMM|nr:ABC transporter permease [Photobacterium galatheae]KDM92547.1 peptide ABC transporter permease [Photobacterium galatheae]MCM0148024.1 ABC transporter permease [Photobacterium galatheae]
MKALMLLAWQSLRNRKTTAMLTVLTIAISTTLLLGVEKVRTQAKASFAHTVAGTDLIVGARSGQVNLLLYSVFRIGNATNNIGWQSYQTLREHKAVKWAIPISLGDSHRGFRVIGTNQDYFQHYQYGQKQHLAFRQGNPFHTLFDTVIGAEVARKLGYQIGDKIIIAHGISDKSFTRHDKLPFTVTGILAPTGTPVDRSVHVSLAAIEAIHVGWESGANLGHTPDAAILSQQSFQPKQITAVLLGLNSKIQTFALQRYINTFPDEPLSAIMPGVALHELWGMMSVAEQALMVVSVFVIIAGLLGMLSSLLTSLNERRREMAILRATGARPGWIAGLLFVESTGLTLTGIIAGMLTLYSGLFLSHAWLLDTFGLYLPIQAPTPYEWMLMGMILLAGMLTSLIPALRAYRLSLADGMTIRI